MEEQNTFTLVLNSKQFKIPFLFENLVHINPIIFNSLILHHQYQVKSNISDTIFKSFLDFLVYNQVPDIAIDDLQSYLQLNKEFQFQSLKEIILKANFKIKFINTIPKMSILEEASNEESEYKNMVVESIAQNLDEYLFLYRNKLFNLPEETLNKIFNHPQRNLTNHNCVYKCITKQKDSKLLYLLPTLECNKLKSKYIKDAITQRKSRGNLIPKIDVQSFLDKAGFMLIPEDEEEAEIRHWNNCEKIDKCGLSFKIDTYNNTAAVINSDNTKENIFIPSTIICYGTEFIVTTIIEAFRGNKNIKTVQFDENSKLKTIGRAAFYESSIESISIPSSVTKICHHAFSKCEKLKSVIIPKSSQLEEIEFAAFTLAVIESIFIPSYIKKIHNFAFAGCENLKTVDIPRNSELKSMGDHSFFGTSIEKIMIPSETSSIKSLSFTNCKNLKTIEIPVNSKLKFFGYMSFYGSLIEKLFIQSEIIYIGESSFGKCTNLKSVIVSNKTKLAEIGDYAFRDSSIETLNLQSEVVSIKNNAFLDCANLKSVMVSNKTKLAEIGNYAFSNSSIEIINLQSEVVSIKNSAFNGCPNLKKFEISKHTKIAEFNSSIFDGSNNLECINISSAKIEFKESWCSGTPNLKKIIVSPENKNYVYKDDQFLLGKTDEMSDNYDILLFSRRDIEKAIIPSNIKIISSYAFERCSNLQYIEFPTESELTTIETNAFALTNAEHIVIPQHVTYLGECALYDKFLNVEFSENLNNITICEYVFGPSIECINISSAKIEFKESWCSETPNLKKIIVSPENKNYVYKDDQFLLGKTDEMSDNYDILLFSRRDIEKAIIPSNIKIISSYAFERCSNLQSIEFPTESELTTIETNAFSSTKIAHILIPQHVVSIGRYAFYDCKYLRYIEFHEKSELKIIGPDTFHATKIEHILIPQHVVSIGKDAFAFCKNLKSIQFYENSKMQNIDSKAFYCSSIRSISIPCAVKFGERCFKDCSNLQIIEFLDSSQLQIISASLFNESTIIMISNNYPTQ